MGNLKHFFYEHRIFFFLLLLALILRLIFLPYAKFENETARDLVLANEMIDHHNLRLKGLSPEVDPGSLQQSFGPIFYYFLAFSQFIFRHPYSAVVLITLFTLLGIFLFYLFVDRYYGRKAAILSAAFFSFNPWIFAFVSLNFANPSFLLPFVILLYFSLHKIIIDHQDAYLILTAVSLASLLQFHLSSLLLLPIVFLFLILFRPSLFLSKYFFLALIVGLLFFIPYIIYTLQHDSLARTLDFVFTSRYEATRFENFRDSVSIPFMLATTYLGPYLLGSFHIFNNTFFEYFFLFLDLVISSFIGLSILFILRTLFSRPFFTRDHLKAFLLLGWFLFPIILAIIPGTNVSPHYLFITYPSQFLLLALFFLRPSFSKYLRFSFIALTLLAYIIYNISFYISIIAYGGTDGIYGIPLQSKINVLTYVNAAQPQGTLLFYGYVKPEYEYLQPYYAQHITLDVIDHYTKNMTGYILLDFYSRGNFAERNMTHEERAFYQNLPSVHVGHIRLVSLEDYASVISIDNFKRTSLRQSLDDL